MKKLKAIIKIILFTSFILIAGIFIPALIINGDQIPLVINGNQIKLKDGTKCTINTEYIIDGQEFRGCWCSALTGDVGGFVSIEQYKTQIIDILENMERFNLNTLIFHIRMKNDACYESEFNNWSSYYNTNPSWDALPWVIEECHRRGIEFHAWLNPYRVSTSSTSDLEGLSKNFPNSNAASNPNNLLQCTSCVILNPGIPEVRDFLVNTCMEIVEKYDVDAIHFDDYFYAAGCDDTETFRQYNSSGLSLTNWRKRQVSLFIEALSNSIRRYNKQNNKRVQLGISPTGVYQNGSGTVTFDKNGNVSSNGSRTSGYAHAGSPLYADTLEWINNEWIDYILPQTYHAITNSAVPYCEITSWWNKVMERTNVNLYCAMGLYMSGGSGNASWGYNDDEAYMQAMYVNKLENAKGIGIYQYSSVLGLTKNKMKGIWDIPVINPEIRTMDPIIIDSVENLKVSTGTNCNILTFSKNEDTKFYCVYRSENPLTYDASEVIDVFGDVSIDGIISFPDESAKAGKTYYYGVKCLSRSNTLSSGVSVCTDEACISDYAILPNLDDIKISDNTIWNEEVLVTWSNLVYQFGSDIKYDVKYSYDDEEKTYEVKTITNYKNLKCAKIKILPERENITVTITAYNNVGKRDYVIKADIYPSLGKLSNFGVLDSVYYNKEVRFSFNSLCRNDCNYIYTLEYSFDSINWYEECSINGTNSFNEVINAIVKTPTVSIYYRIKAEYNNRFTYSNALNFSSKEYLGEPNRIIVNDNRYSEPIICKENDTVTISVKNQNSDSSFIIMYSSNGINYISMKNYSQSFKTEVSSDKVIYTIPINYKAYKLYIKLTEVNGSKETELEPIEIYCGLEFMYSDEILQYFFNETNDLVSKLDLFN